MLYLITGSNGAGKSLRAIWRMYKDHADGKRVFHNGFRNLRVPFAEEFPDPRKWRDMPPNSVLYIDEAQRVWRTRPPTVKPPPEVIDLETHRHQGIDIVLITQAPTLIDSHIRHLISGHEHLIAWGQSASRVFKFAECFDDVKSLGTRGRGEYEEWPHPKAHYGDYDSAEVHTKKPPIPWRHYAGRALFVLAALVGVWGAWSVYTHYIADPEPGESDSTPAKPKPGKSASASLFSFSGKEGPRYPTLDAYNRAHAARDAARPWTAPVFDEREVVAEPEVYCMASGEGRDVSCSCITEQGTRYLLSPGQCQRIARWGPAYNAYRAPSKPPSGAVASASGDASGANEPLRIMDGSDPSTSPGLIPFDATPPFPLPVTGPATPPQEAP